jgi:Tol biopolymer transport system component
MDVYRYDISSRETVRVTSTPESEYSPTVTPDGKHLSVIRVDADGTQRLWRFTIDGTNPAVLLTDVKPVGYHAWLDETTLALFVLGQPATLQIADTRTGKATIAARDIGQSIQRIPSGGVSFVQQEGERNARTLTIMKVSVTAGQPVITRLTRAVEGATQAHVTWTPDGTLLMAHNGTLHAWKEAAPSWRPVADLATLGLRSVTRLAVSPAGDRLAIVALP